MPYIVLEELEEGQEEADVVERSKFDELSEQLKSVTEQRDEAIDRAVNAENDYAAMRQKYADTFLQKPRPQQAKSKPENVPPQSLAELFGN